MREIKFRAWDNENKKMEIVGAIDWAGEGDELATITCNTRTQKMYQMYPYDERHGFVLMQYTGLKDKNGKEIYEGDLLKIFDAVYEVKIVVTGGRCEVEYGLGRKHNGPAPHWVEVIGNIYESPNLLKS